MYRQSVGGVREAVPGFHHQDGLVHDGAAAVTATERHFGPLAVLVNNAGVPIEAIERRVWDRVLDVNLTGTFLGIKAVTPSPRRNGGGVIVNIAPR